MNQIHFTFDFEKTLQASALILHLHDRKVGIMRLLKILYIADRELLAETGSTLTGDHAYAMKKGPVLSAVYDLAKMQSSHSAAWDSFIQKTGYFLSLKSDPGRGKLSKAESEKIHKICEKYCEFDDCDLSEVTHGFAEWERAFDHSHPDSSNRMSWEDALSAQGKDELIEEIKSEVAEKRLIDAVFEYQH